MDVLLRKIKTMSESGKKGKLSQKEIAGAIDLLSIEDMKLRFLIGNTIVRQGSISIPALIEGTNSEVAEVRRSSVYLLGKLVSRKQEASSEILDTLHHALRDEDPKVCKNSAVVLGSLRMSQSVEHLKSALIVEKVEWVRSSLILALGAIGGKDVAEFLASYKFEYESEKEALRKAIDRVVEQKTTLQFVQNLGEPVPIELWTFKGLEPVLEQEAEEKLGLKLQRIADGILHTESKDVYSLFLLRTFSELLIPLGVANIHSIEDISEKTTQLLFNNHTIDKISTLHKGDVGHIRYRLEVRGEAIKHYVRRRIISETQEYIDTHSSAFINSPSNYDIELRLVMKGNTLEVLWKPFTIPDTRFSYRIHDVPASIDPVAAAGIMRFLKSNSSSQHRVIDPFCGSGTLLIERAFAKKYEELVGVDISQEAIQVAKANIIASGIQNIKLINDDMRNVLHHEHRRFHEIISNMPFGIRTGSHETNVKLYRDFFNMIPRILEENGLAILYTQEVSLTTALFRTSGNLRLLDIHRIETGGLRPAVFIACNG
ncbi:MAG: methyltransferase [Caldisericia bacterium]